MKGQIISISIRAKDFKGLRALKHIKMLAEEEATDVSRVIRNALVEYSEKKLKEKQND